jgi:putative endonuclease
VGISEPGTLRGELGRRAEQLALDYLLGRRLRLIERNFRSRFGEIDLVMVDGDCLVFVEVRYRRASRFGSASASVDRHKQRKLIQAASLYISGRRRCADQTTRFDVVAIDGGNDAVPRVQWIKDAFRPGD